MNATARASVAPVRTTRYVDVRCPDCRTYRVVTLRHARRVRSGEHTGVCASCRGTEASTVPFGTKHISFWLREFGADVTVMPGTSWRDLFEAGIVPDELIALAKELWPQ